MKRQHQNAQQDTTHRNHWMPMLQLHTDRADTRLSNQPTLNLPYQSGLRGMRRNSRTRASFPNHNVLQGRACTQRRHQGSSGRVRKPDSLMMHELGRPSRYGQHASHTSRQGTEPKPAPCPARLPGPLALLRRRYNRASMAEAFARCVRTTNMCHQRLDPRPRCAASTCQNCKAAAGSTASCNRACSARTTLHYFRPPNMAPCRAAIQWKTCG